MMGAIYGPDGVFTGQLVAGSSESLMLRMVPDGLSVWRYETSPPDPLRWRVEGGELVDYRPPAPPDTDREVWSWDASAWRWVPSLTVAAAVAAAALQIDDAAGRARARYITTVPGQDATYTAKFAEAVAYQDAGYPEDLAGFPYIAGESAPRADRTAREAADRIVRLGRLWGEVIGPQIEGVRVNGKDRIGALGDAGAIAEAAAQVVAVLDAI